MLEFLLRQSVSDFVIHENDESILSLQTYADSDSDELESSMLERLDYYISRNALFFESLLFEKNWNEETDDKGMAKKVNRSGTSKKILHMKDYKTTNKANVPNDKSKENKEQNAKDKAKAKSDIDKASMSNIIKMKLGAAKFKKVIKTTSSKALKKIKSNKKLKKFVGSKMKKLNDSRRKAKKEFKKSASEYEKYVNSEDMVAKKEKLRQAVQHKKAIGKKRFRRSLLAMGVRRLR